MRTEEEVRRAAYLFREPRFGIIEADGPAKELRVTVKMVLDWMTEEDSPAAFAFTRSLYELECAEGLVSAESGKPN